MKQDTKKSTDNLMKQSEAIVAFVTKHRIVIVFALAGAAILAALIQSNSYLNPPRNEAIYQDGVLLINYSQIDQEVVEKLRSSQNFTDIEIISDFVPNRDNPFVE